MGLIHFSLGVGTQLHRLHVLNRQIAGMTTPALGAHPPDDPVAALRAGIIKMSKRLALIGGNTGKDSPLEALRAISRDVPKRFPIEMQDVAVDDTGLRLAGEADSFTTVDQMKKALLQDDYFGNIEVTHAKAETDGKVEFQVEAQVQGRDNNRINGAMSNFLRKLLDRIRTLMVRLGALLRPLGSRITEPLEPYLERVQESIRPLTSQLRSRYQKLESRERTLVKLAGAVLALFLAYDLVYLPISNWRDSLDTLIETRHRETGEVQHLVETFLQRKKQLQDAERNTVPMGKDFSLFSIIESSLTKSVGPRKNRLDHARRRSQTFGWLRAVQRRAQVAGCKSWAGGRCALCGQNAVGAGRGLLDAHHPPHSGHPYLRC